MNSFPVEVNCHIFEYLPPKDLVHTSITCKKFHDMIEYLPASLLIPKLNPTVIQENALMLWSFSKGNFNVDNKGRLVRIKTFHLFTRAFKHLNYKKINLKVNRVIELTFKEIYRLNQQGYIQKEEDVPTHSSPQRIYVWKIDDWDSNYCSAAKLADKILVSKQFIDFNIHKAAKLVKNQTILYTDSSYIVKERKYKGIKWIDKRLKDAFFCKAFKKSKANKPIALYQKNYGIYRMDKVFFSRRTGKPYLDNEGTPWGEYYLPESAAFRTYASGSLI